jgi:hypothetical protein
VTCKSGVGAEELSGLTIDSADDGAGRRTGLIPKTAPEPVCVAGRRKSPDGKRAAGANPRAQGARVQICTGPGPEKAEDAGDRYLYANSLHSSITEYLVSAPFVFVVTTSLVGTCSSVVVVS